MLEIKRQSYGKTAPVTDIIQNSCLTAKLKYYIDSITVTLVWLVALIWLTLMLASLLSSYNYKDLILTKLSLNWTVTFDYDS